MDEQRVIDRQGLDRLVDVLRADGYRVVGPTVRDGAVVLAELTSAAELPSGWGVETAPGHYRLQRRPDRAVFAHSPGPQSWKQVLHPAREQLWTSEAPGEYRAPEPDDVRYALLGVRGCDLAAIAVMDRVLARGAHPGSGYTRRRAAMFVVAAHCTEPGGVCFCTSMGCGPAAGPGYDLALTEQLDAEGHRFVVNVGSAEGARSSRPCRSETRARARSRQHATPSRRPRTGWAARCRPSTCPICCEKPGSRRTGRTSPAAA